MRSYSGWSARVMVGLGPLTVAVMMALLVPGATAGQVADSQRGTLIVLNKSAHTATFIDVTSGATVATLPTGQGPHELAITRDGRWAVTTDYGGGNSLTVIDVEKAEVVRTVDFSGYPRPHGAFFLPGDEVLAVTSEASRNVVLVRPLEGEIIGAIDTGAGGSHMVAVTGDGETLFTGDMQANTVTQLDVASRSKTASFPVPQTPEAITVSQDGTQVWVGSNAQGTVSILDPATGEVDSRLGGFEWPYRILILEDHDLVVIPDMGREYVRFIEYSTRTEVGRIELPGEGPQGIILTPDGATLFLSLSRSNEVAVIDVASRSIVRRIPAGPSPDGIGWSSLRPAG